MEPIEELIERLDRVAVAVGLGRPALWGIAEIGAYIGMSESTARQITARPGFPAPIKVLDGPKGRRWKPAEVEAWLDAQREPIRKRRRAA